MTDGNKNNCRAEKSNTSLGILPVEGNYSNVFRLLMPYKIYNVSHLHWLFSPKTHLIMRTAKKIIRDQINLVVETYKPLREGLDEQEREDLESFVRCSEILSSKKRVKKRIIYDVFWTIVVLFHVAMFVSHL